MAKKKHMNWNDFFEWTQEQLTAEEIVIRTVKPFGRKNEDGTISGAHITQISPDFIGRKVKVIIPKKNKTEGNGKES